MDKTMKKIDLEAMKKRNDARTRKDNRGGHNKTHNRSRTPLHSAWMMMRQRCENPNNHAYRNYGGRGIKVCARWSSFANFLEDMGERPKGLTLERVDNDGDYCKKNCKWASRRRQSRNRRDNINITIKGVTKCVSDWADHFGIPRQTVYTRLVNGWSHKEALRVF